jgi:hypothetical protein
MAIISHFRKEGILLQKEQLNNFLITARKKKLGTEKFWNRSIDA